MPSLFGNRPEAKRAFSLTAFWLVVIGFAAGGRCLWAQESSSDSKATAGKVDESERSNGIRSNVEDLVQLLKDSKFEVRERAAVQLLAIGMDASEALSQIPTNWPTDARRLAAKLLAEIEHRAVSQRTKDFLVEQDPNQSHGLPGWDVFRGIVGSSRCSKLLFLEMVETERPLLQQIDLLNRQRLAGNDCSQLQQDLSARISQRSAVLHPRIYRGMQTSIGESTAVLLATTMLDSTAPIEANQLVYSSVQLSFFGYLSKPGYRQCFQKLLGLWIPKTHDELAPEVMRIAFELDLPTVLPIARRYLAEGFDKYSRENAIFCVGKFGDVSDLPELLKMASDKTIVHEFNESVQGFEESSAAPPGLHGVSAVNSVRKVVRINDLSAAAAMVLMKQDLSQCFPRFSRENFFNRSVALLAVLDEESELRNEAIKVWVQAQLAKALES